MNSPARRKRMTRRKEYWEVYFGISIVCRWQFWVYAPYVLRCSLCCCAEGTQTVVGCGHASVWHWLLGF